MLTGTDPLSDLVKPVLSHYPLDLVPIVPMYRLPLSANIARIHFANRAYTTFVCPFGSRGSV